MAILRPIRDKTTMEGVTKHLVLPAFSFATDSKMADQLADLIVTAWDDPKLKAQLLERDPKTHLPTQEAQNVAKAEVNKRGLDLTRVVVITEEEHNNDYIMQSDDEIVFVLPNADRVTPSGRHTLDTAKFLMACTPNGI
jgi:hypothetical protein